MEKKYYLLPADMNLFMQTNYALFFTTHSYCRKRRQSKMYSISYYRVLYGTVGTSPDKYISSVFLPLFPIPKYYTANNIFQNENSELLHYKVGSENDQKKGKLYLLTSSPGSKVKNGSGQHSHLEQMMLHKTSQP